MAAGGRRPGDQVQVVARRGSSFAPTASDADEAGTLVHEHHLQTGHRRRETIVIAGHDHSVAMIQLADVLLQRLPGGRQALGVLADGFGAGWCCRSSCS